MDFLIKNSEQGAFAMCDPSSGAAQCGLSKREYFAAMAMQGLISVSGSSVDLRDKYTVNGGWVHPATVAKSAIEMADELLKQLEL